MDLSGMNVVGLASLAAFAQVPGGPPADAAPRPLAVADALGQKAFPVRMPFAIAPDGRRIAYTLQDPARRTAPVSRPFSFHTATGVPTDFVGTDVWVLDVETGTARDVTGGRGSSWGPVWSPEGRRLAFCSDRDGAARLWAWDADSGRLRALSDAVVRPLYGFDLPRWTPDGRKLLMKLLPEGVAPEDADTWTDRARPRGGEAAPGAGVTASVHRSPPPAEGVGSAVRIKGVGQETADLALIDAEGGGVERLARRLAVRGWWVSPDGSRVAFSSLRGFGGLEVRQALYDLYVVEPGGTPPRMVAAEQPLDYGVTLSWSPDGRRLAYLTSGPAARGDCLLVPAEGDAAPENLTPGDHPDFGHAYRAPLWSGDGGSVYLLGDGLWRVDVAGRTRQRVSRPGGPVISEVLARPGRAWSPDGGRSMLLVTRDDDTKRAGFERLDLATGERALLRDEDRSFGGFPLSSMAVSPDGTRVVYAAEGPQSPPDLWDAGVDLKEPRRLTRINPGLDGYRFGAGRVVRWRAGDGRELRGALLLPAGYHEGRRYPLVVDVYAGGRHSNSVFRFGSAGGVGVENLQLLATRGYAVFVPDIPVRTGRVVDDLCDAVLPGVESLVGSGVTDPDRVGVMGFSFGGYSTLALVSRTTRFRAAVMRGGLGDLVSLYGMMDPNGNSGGVPQMEDGDEGMGGPPWGVPLRYVENSPVFHLDRVATPLLILHGSLDAAAPVAQAEEVFIGLRRLGKEAVYVRYEGEEHWPGRWAAANAADQAERLLGWFDAHLGATAAPAK